MLRYVWLNVKARPFQTLQSKQPRVYMNTHTHTVDIKDFSILEVGLKLTNFETGSYNFSSTYLIRIDKQNPKRQ